MIKNIRKEKGITLIALVVTIIVLLILAGVTVSMLTGDNGLLNRAGEAKVLTEEAAEKEKVQLAVMAAEEANGITNESLQKALDVEFGKEKTKSKIFEDGEITIIVTDTGREYYIDKNGNITMSNTTAIADEEGLSGGGTQANPYKISSIEDLIKLSNDVNTGGAYNYYNKYIELTRDLDFRSINSYINAMAVDEETGKDLITRMTTGEGFTPIGDSSHFMNARFDGKGHCIKNLYENREEFVALFYMSDGWSSYINNLTLKNVYLKSTGSDSGGLCMGGCPVTNCHIDGTIISETGNASGCLGSLKEAKNCSIDCTIKAKENASGFNGGRNVTNCIVKGNIEGRHAGGFAARRWQPLDSYDGCINYANITGSERAGGVTGSSDGSPDLRVVNFSNYGTITWTGGGTHQGGGGLVGWPAGGVSIENSVNYGEVKSTADGTHTYFSGIGGVLGNGSVSNLINVLSLGNVNPKAPLATNYGSIIGLPSWVGNYTCVYYKAGIAEKMVGNNRNNPTINRINVEEKEDTYLKSQNFVNELNSLIEAGKTINNDVTDDPETEKDEREVTIDTNGYAKWVYNPEDYPTLDLTTKWNGTTWVKE